MIRYILSLLILVMAVSCAPVEDVHQPDMTPTPISSHVYRGESVLNIEFAIPNKDFKYSSLLNDNGVDYSLVLNNIKSPLGNINIVRPALSVTTKTYPSGYKIDFKLANKSRLETVKTPLGLHIKLYSLEPDMEMLAMEKFGGWAMPVTPAKVFTGVDNVDNMSVIHFDNPPVFAEGKAGGRYYLDIFGVNLPSGSIKFSDLAVVNRMGHKTRLIFKKPFSYCAKGDSLTLGKSCKPYSALYNFQREKSDSSESFLFMMPGRPDMVQDRDKGIVAFGFKDTKLFSRGLYRFNDGMVYKVEAREKDGLLWLIFLLNEDASFRKYYSGDKFFVVFYRSDK